MSLGLYAYGLYVLVIWPITHFGVNLYGISLLFLGIAIALCFALIAGFGWLRDHPPKPKAEKPKSKFMQNIDDIGTLFIAWIISAKHKVCPVVEMRDE